MECCPRLAPGESAVHLGLQAGLDPATHPEMALIPPGRWTIGEDREVANAGDREGPTREIQLPSFLIDKTSVTNREFARFVNRTGYVTQAERQGWSFVFASQVHSTALQKPPSDELAPDWWLAIEGACWRRPNGGTAEFDALADHPVVHVSWTDAMAFAAFNGKGLPTEEQWEVAARGGLHRAIYAWGDDPMPNGQHMCNIWQGRFPMYNSGEDGFFATAPVRSFPPNGFGLFEVLGNVWEWTASPWADNASGLMSMRGGSYLCHASYCNRYRVSARTKNAVQATSSHLGFRCSAWAILKT